MKYILSATDKIKQSDFNTSVQMILFTPPRKVYNQTRKTVNTTLRMKGRCKGSKTNNCNVRHTRNKRTEAPSILDIKKNQAPVL
jgi:hypothetical protein